MPSLVEIGPVVLEKKMKMWKVYDNANNDDNNENGGNKGKRTNFDQKSSLEPLAQVSSKGVALHLNNIEIALRKDSLRQVRLKFA